VTSLVLVQCFILILAVRGISTETNETAAVTTPEETTTTEEATTSKDTAATATAEPTESTTEDVTTASPFCFNDTICSDTEFCAHTGTGFKSMYSNINGTVKNETTAFNDTASCETKREDGERCLSSGECLSGHCSMFMCQTCVDDEECGDGMFCNGGWFTASKCEKKGSEGESCSSANGCLTGLHCRSNGLFSGSTCEGKGAAGESCSSDDECLTGLKCHSASVMSFWDTTCEAEDDCWLGLQFFC